MKILNPICFTIFLLSFFNCSAIAQSKDQTFVGIIKDGNPILEVDQEKMLSTYNENLLKISGIDAKFNSINIVNSLDNQYFLIFKGNEYTSSFVVTSIEFKLFALNTISCTTSECASEAFGCTPKLNGVQCYPCNNKGKCTKTVSSGSLID